MKLAQEMYENGRSRVRFGEGLNDNSEVKIGVHRGSALSQLLFIIGFRLCHGSFELEDHYADDLVIIADSMEECVPGLLTWKKVSRGRG